MSEEFGPTGDTGNGYLGQKKYVPGDRLACCGCLASGVIPTPVDCGCRCHEAPRILRHVA